MTAWLTSLFQAIATFIKENIPAIAIAIYTQLQQKIKRKENENIELQTKLDIEKEKKAHEDVTKNLSDAEYIDKFIGQSRGEDK